MLTRQEITEKLKDILLFADPNGAEKIEKATEDEVLTSDLGFSSVSILYMAPASLIEGSSPLKVVPPSTLYESVVPSAIFAEAIRLCEAPS